MIAKVGRSRSMLICADCGHPREPGQEPALGMQRLVGSLVMFGLAAVAGMAFFLAQVSEQRADMIQPSERLERQRTIAGE
jgi:hypothetical protein